jgi:hypothetical protein
MRTSKAQLEEIAILDAAKCGGRSLMKSHLKPAPTLVKKAEDTKPAAPILRQKSAKGERRISRDAVVAKMAPSTLRKLATVNSGATAICPQCNKAFVKRGYPQQFCSRNCRQTHWRRTQAGYLARVRQRVAELAAAEGAIDFDPLADGQVNAIFDRLDPLKDAQINAIFDRLDPLRDAQINAIFDRLNPQPVPARPVSGPKVLRNSSRC